MLVSSTSADAQHLGRGVNVPPFIGASHIDNLAEWNVNVIRWQMFWDSDNREQQFRHLNDVIIPQCELQGIGIVIDLHSPPGGLTRSGLHRFMRAKHSSYVEFPSVWAWISAAYKDEPVVIG